MNNKMKLLDYLYIKFQLNAIMKIIASCDQSNLEKFSKDFLKEKYKKIKILLNTETGDNSLKYLSILKIFKSIIPLYKIRLLKDKVKHKKEQDKVSKEDIAILKMYSYFINKICSEDTYCCYKIACEVLEHFDHFNYTDIIVKKILKGTLKENIVSDMCIETLRKKYFLILIKILLFSDVLSLLINIKILDKEKIDEEKNNLKNNLKIEKLRRKKESDVRKDENLDKNQEEYIFHRKIIDGEFIRKEFYEGLYILLNENLELCTYEDKLECILTILCIYSDYKYDFKKISTQRY
ncbi:nuclear pre-ribosomes export protein [Vairimorpha apis BRL 01]|uniref:Nuclear pre-ribosomes export protein n=1 Tax=Vairimorpha apis BRL 01 TaxID=1037528 RepID=T0MEX2_9MICR|nr:nuclear pre-ribosomes export protein [Vairimorpha apis BRL 01]